MRVIQIFKKFTFLRGLSFVWLPGSSGDARFIEFVSFELSVGLRLIITLLVT